MRYALLLALSLLACSACTPPQQGDECTPTNTCSTGLVCNRCNGAPADGGANDAGGQSFCQHPCTIDGDCTGTNDVHFGPTPRCISDLCGAHFCGPNI